MNGIILAISRRDTLKALGIWFWPFPNNARDTKYQHTGQAEANWWLIAMTVVCVCVCLCVTHWDLAEAAAAAIAICLK